MREFTADHKPSGTEITLALLRVQARSVHNVLLNTKSLIFSTRRALPSSSSDQLFFWGVRIDFPKVLYNYQLEN